MKYTKKAIARAEEELDRRRESAEEQQREREARIVAEVPEIAAMRRSMREDYFSLIRKIASHAPDAAAEAREIRDRNVAVSERIAVMLENLTGDRDYLDVKYTCPVCMDKGYHDGVRCECFEELLKKYTVEELNESSSINLRNFSEYRSDLYPEGEIRQFMDRVCENLKLYCASFSDSSKSMLFVGATGLGKTFFSSCIAKALGEKGIPAAFMSAYDMLRTIENEHFGRSEGSTMEHLLSVKLLIIDDLGAEPPSKYYETFLYNIINGRINRSLPTIISTNLTGDKLLERYHDRIASRIMSEYLTILFRGSDIRQQKAMERMRKK